MRPLFYVQGIRWVDRRLNAQEPAYLPANIEKIMAAALARRFSAELVESRYYANAPQAGPLNGLPVVEH